MENLTYFPENRKTASSEQPPPLVSKSVEKELYDTFVTSTEISWYKENVKIVTKFTPNTGKRRMALLRD